MNIAFREPDSFSALKVLIDFLWKQDLGYPSYDSWVDRTRSEIDGGYKQAIVAYEDEKIVGDVIFQPHKEIVGIREIKNLRVDKDVRYRRFGSFLLRQAEWIDAAAYTLLIADFRADQNNVERLLLSEGFEITATQNLYDDKLDKIATKFNPFRKLSNVPAY